MTDRQPLEDGRGVDAVAIAAQLSVLRTVVAFLLATDSVESGYPLHELHEALVQEYQFDDVLPDDQLASFQAKAASALDDVFSLAENLRRVVKR